MQDTVFGHRSMLIAVVTISIILIYYRHHYHRLDCSSSLDRKLFPCYGRLCFLCVCITSTLWCSLSPPPPSPTPPLPHTHTNTRFLYCFIMYFSLRPPPPFSSDLLVEYSVYLYHQYHLFLPLWVHPDITTIKWLTGRKTPSYYFPFELLIDMSCAFRLSPVLSVSPLFQFWLYCSVVVGYRCVVRGQTSLWYSTVSCQYCLRESVTSSVFVCD